MQYLHTMIRVSDVDASLDFFCGKLGLVQVSRNDYEKGRFSLIFLAAPEDLERATADRAPPPAPPVADFRNIPEAANVGVMSPPEGRQVYIDGKEMWLAPGSRIRDLNNRIIRPGTLEEPVNVRYTLDQNEQVHHVWLLAER